MLGFALTLELLSCAGYPLSICEANYSSRQYASEGWDNIPPTMGFIPLHYILHDVVVRVRCTPNAAFSNSKLGPLFIGLFEYRCRPWCKNLRWKVNIENKLRVMATVSHASHGLVNHASHP
jgi:hypothetical protein